MENDEPARATAWGPAALGSLALTLLVVLATFVILQATATVSIALVLAVLLAVLFAPVAARLEGWGLPRAASSAAVILVVLVAVGAVALLFYLSLAELMSQQAAYVERWAAIEADLSRMTTERIGVDVPEELRGQVAGERGQALAVLARGFDSVTSVASASVFILLFLAYLVASRRHLYAKVVDAAATLGWGDEGSADAVLADVGERIRVYLWVKSVVSVSTGVAFGSVAALLGLDFPLVWGFLGFALNYIPSIGPLVAMVPPIVVAFLQFDGIAYPLFVSVAMGSVQFLSGNVIEPTVLGHRLGLNFLTVLISISVFGLLWGFVGMVLAVPLTAALVTALGHTERHRAIAVLLSD
ncbi:MAG: AI-2E family transporter [Sandaracinaceae bacterium]